MRKKLLFNCTKLFQKQACVSDNHELNDSSLISKNKHIVMKKLLLLFFMFMLAMTAMAQRTQKITYQAVVRDAANRLVVYTPVRVDVTITSSTGSYF